ncbi:oligoendopeptidase F [Halosegnis longus]|uniref:Oligoendopeptidase F n=1 Tax=Halosegnis longus TaxID=2216012 RepID=A0AAJ4RAB9_9EURY|nr:oligoendopeptidase F [Salella cibi]RNJ27165.1 oligoendopeptidase F [Salella cibi]
MSSVPERGDIDEEFTWALEEMFVSDEEWEEAYETVESRLDELSAYEGRVTEDAETLHEVLQLREELMRTVANVTSYARMRSDEDTRDQEYQALKARAQSLASDASSAASFIEPELQRASREELEAFVDSEPALEQYDHYLDDVLRMKPHTRSPEVEEVLADLSEVTSAPSDIYGMLSNADMSFPVVEGPDGDDIEITQSNFTTHLNDEDRAFRRRVYEGYMGEWGNVRNTVASSLKNGVTADVKTARARNYETAREAALDDTNVPPAVYDNLVETVRDNVDVLQRHVDLKRDRLGVDTLEMYDLYAPLTDEEPPEVPYEQAKEWVIEAVAPLGEAYQSRMAEGLDSRWVDVYENKGKRSGAYSAGTYDSQPYILMNYQDDATSMFTLAHELGHSMHSELTSEEQPYVYSNYEIFVAEVASTVNEALLTHHLLDTVEDETLRRHILDEYLERFRSTLFRQTLFADFEHQIHSVVEEGGALTPDAMDEMYGDLKREFYANANVDDHIEREWMRIPHFYYNYYVYQYATGISAANAIVDRILDEGEPAAQDYLDFLRLGSREYPLDLLAGAGVDMRSPDVVESAIEAYDSYVAEFEQLS